MEIFKLFGSIFVDSSDADKSISSTSKNAENLASKLGKGVVGGAKAAGAAIAAAGTAAAALGATMFATAKKTAEYGDKVDKNSQKLGISRKAYQEWDAVLKHSGSSIDNVSKVFKEFSDIAINATDDQVEAFEKLGLSMEDIGNMSPEEIFAATIEGLQGMEEGAERSALASTLLGKSASELAPLLNTSAEETQKMIDDVNKLGGVMSDDAVKNSAAFNDALQDLQTAFGGIVNEVGAAVMPIFTDLMNWVTEHMPEIRDTVVGVMEKVTDFWNETLWPALKEIIKVVSEDVVPRVKDALDQLIKFWNEHLQPMLKTLYEFIRDEVAPIVVAAFATISDFWNNTLKPALDDFWTFVSETVAPKVEDAIGSVKNTFEGFMSACDRIWSKVREVFDNIYSKVTGVVDWVKQKVEELKALLSNLSSMNPTTAVDEKGNPKYTASDGYMITPYAKAYDSPYLLDTPTVFGQNGDELLLGGDRGKTNGGELVYSRDKLMSDISEASGSEQVVALLSQMLEVFSAYFPQFAQPPVFDGNYLAVSMTPTIAREMERRKGRGF